MQPALEKRHLPETKEDNMNFRSLLLCVSILTLALLANACATTTTSLTVDRAPKMFLAKLGSVGTSTNAVTGVSMTKRLKGCVEKNNVFSDKDPYKVVTNEALNAADASYYQKLVEDGLAKALAEAKPPIKATNGAQGDVVLTVTPVVEEVVGVESRLAGSTGKGLNPPPQREGGVCEAFQKGKDNSSNYDWGYDISSNSTLKLNVDLQRAGAPLSSETLTLKSGVYRSQQGFLEKDPDFPKEYFDLQWDGSRVRHPIVYADFVKAGREGLNTQVAEAFFKLIAPYKEKLSVTVYKLSKPEGLDKAVELIENEKWAEAETLLAAKLASVRADTSLSPKDRSHVIYDFALCQLALGKFSEALKAFNEAKDLYKEDEYGKMIKETERIIRDSGELSNTPKQS